MLSGAELLAKPCTNRRGTRQQGAEVIREEREQVAAAGGGGGLFLPYGPHRLGGVLRTLVAVAKDTSREGRAQEVLQLNMGRSMLRSSIGRGPGALVSTVPSRSAHPSRRHNECMHWATEPLGSTACQSMTDGPGRRCVEVCLAIEWSRRDTDSERVQKQMAHEKAAMPVKTTPAHRRHHRHRLHRLAAAITGAASLTHHGIHCA